MSIALVAVAKLEEKYLIEWVQYYLYIGFDMIYLYENNKEPIYAELLQEFPNVKVIHFPSDGTPVRSTQFYVLEDFCAKYKNNHTWMAHFDIDEFLVLKKHGTIHEFCQEYLGNEEGGIVVPWTHFGNNGRETYDNEPVTSRFTKREDMTLTKTAFVKSIACTSCIKEYIDWHIPTLSQGSMKTTDGHILKKREIDKRSITVDVIQLNHYFCKTKEEFKVKKLRGEVGVPITHPSKFGKSDRGRYHPSMFDRYNLNQVDDFFAKEKYEECIRQKETPK